MPFTRWSLSLSLYLSFSSWNNFRAELLPNGMLSDDSPLQIPPGLLIPSLRKGNRFAYNWIFRDFVVKIDVILAVSTINSNNKSIFPSIYCWCRQKQAQFCSNWLSLPVSLLRIVHCFDVRGIKLYFHAIQATGSHYLPMRIQFCYINFYGRWKCRLLTLIIVP